MNPGYSTHSIDPFVAEVTDRDEDHSLAVAWVDSNNLSTVASLKGVRSIEEVIPPVVNIGSVTTQGDTIHKTSDVRSLYGYRGAGMKIGIISNGVNNIAASKASGDLPADVTVLSDTQGGDEGTAMLEIVHDMVPDAKLYFHDCGSNTVAFNAAIDELQANGCTIICDDMSWFNEPYFEDGIIASNVATLLSDHPVIYLSSAGNHARRHYQGDFVDDGYGYDNKYHYVNMPTGSSVVVFLQWNDQFAHSTNDYNLALFDASTYDLLSYSVNSQTGTQNPYEYLYYQNTGSPRDVEIDVYKYSGVAKTLELFIVPESGAVLYSNNIVESDSIFGHPAVPDVIAVAAVPASSPSTIESFSSRGPVTISYPSAVSRPKPDISGVDCVVVTGVGGFGSPFCGTSASAPHIAAIAAQIWGDHPSLTPAQVRNALYASAVDLGTAGKDTTFGYGRADALAMATNFPVNEGIAVFRPSTGYWYFDYNLDGIVDKSFRYGGSTDQIIKGDWNGDGSDGIAIFRPSSGYWYFDYNLDGIVDKSFRYGGSADQIIAGKWA
jgi:subtilisin family serine protease